MRCSKLVRFVIPAFFLTSSLAGIALGFVDSGGPQEGTARSWDCTQTSCSVVNPKKSCPAGEFACCCNASATGVPAWVAVCYANADCGGVSSCQMCQ